MTEDIKLTIDVYRKMPKAISNSKKKLQQALNELRPTTKPDID